MHASKDHVEIRAKFIEFLRKEKDVKCYVAIGRKQPDIFHNKHNGNAAEFYFDLLNKLLFQFDFPPNGNFTLYLSQKQSNTVERFEKALERALSKQSKRMSSASFKCSIVLSQDVPEMSVIDYYLWVLKRYITTGEKRYFTALADRFVSINDVYENGGKGIIYDEYNPFDRSKASKFEVK